MHAMVSWIEIPRGDPNAFAIARRAVCIDDLATALPILERLSVAEPNDAELELYLAWTRYRLDTTTDGGALAEIETLARAALVAHVSLALPLCILAHAAARRRELRVARALFRHAAEADPSFVDARRGVRAIEQALAHTPASRAPVVAAVVVALSLSLLGFLRLV